MDHSSTLGSSPRLPVSVSGTGTMTICLGGFLGSLFTLSITLAEASVYYWVSAKPADFPTSPIPTPFNVHFRQDAGLSLLRHPIAQYSSMGILTHCPSRSPLGYRLGPDLPAVDEHCRGTLSLSVGRFLACLIVTYAYICFSIRSTNHYQSASPLIECSPTTRIATNPELRY